MERAKDGTPLARGVVAVVCGALLGVTGCAGSKDEPRQSEVPPGEIVGGPVTPGDPGGGVVDVPTQPATDCFSSEVAVFELAKFWTFDRFFWNEDANPVPAEQWLERERLAKADVDECFQGVGVESTEPVAGTCETGVPKRNQAYVWGLTRTDRTLWFGTVANTHCLVLGAIAEGFTMDANDYWVCEGDASASGTGDWRPPELHRFDLDARTLGSLNPDAGTLADTLRRTTLGFRSAGEADGVVFIAGPGLGGGIHVFAFDADTGGLLGATRLLAYSDIRTWVKVNGVLYAGVGNAAADATAPGAGSVLRWRGTKSADPAELFRFELVGRTDSEAANLAEHLGRLYVTTWPSAELGGGADLHPAALFRSPPIPETGLDGSAADAWEKIWSVSEYDPDPLVARTTGGGAIASFNGKLYWGTMNVPFLATAAAEAQHRAGAMDLDANGNGALDPAELLATALGTHRSAAVFVLTEPDGFVKTVWGDRYLPRYDAERKSYTIAKDAAHRNPYGTTPTRGSSGFGNFFNAYIWSMAEYQDALYIGTFDWTQLARVGAQQVAGLPVTELDAKELFLSQLGSRLPREGADLVRIDCRGCAGAETLVGFGNDRNYGVRTMIADDDALWVGTANPMNLHPEGGWELLELRALPYTIAPEAQW